MRLTGLSGNEMYCLARKGWSPGNVVVGNSVHSLGVVRGIGAGLTRLAGGEIDSITEMISDGRHAAIHRIEREAIEAGAQGLTGVNSELRSLGGLVEFLAIGSAIYSREHRGKFFSSACSGQDLYCHFDSGYEPQHFVMGNVAYALGVGRGISGALKQMTVRGEVKEYSDMYNHTRHLALARIEQDARQRGCNAVVDIATHIMPFGPGVREMLMVGTGSLHPALGSSNTPVTSELTGEELWNLTHMGFAPLKLVLGTSVYALGLAGGIRTFFRSMARGEVDDVTRLIYEARENCLAHIERDAKAVHADGVIGIKVLVYEIGSGLVEVLAIGTAIRKNHQVGNATDHLLPQAIIRDRQTFFDDVFTGQTRSGDRPSKRAAPAAAPANQGCTLLFLAFFALMFVVPLLLAIVVFVLKVFAGH